MVVRIELGCPVVGMPKELAYLPQFDALLRHPRSNRMPQGVRRGADDAGSFASASKAALDVGFRMGVAIPCPADVEHRDRNLAAVLRSLEGVNDETDVTIAPLIGIAEEAKQPPRYADMRPSLVR